MNRTHLEHLIVALVIQLLFLLAIGDWGVGAVAATFLFVGREHAQREYVISNPAQLVGYEALDFWRWELDSQLDLLVPVLGVLAVFLMSEA